MVRMGFFFRKSAWCWGFLLPFMANSQAQPWALEMLARPTPYGSAPPLVDEAPVSPISPFDTIDNSQESLANRRSAGVNFSMAGVDGDRQGLIAWVVARQDHLGKPFVVADKAAGLIAVVSTNGQIVEETPALFGKKIGDRAVLGMTPAGAFTLQRHLTDEAGYGGDVMFFWSEDGADYALHRTYTLERPERREQRLSSASIADNRISNGCINISPAFYDRVVGLMDGAKLYILPERSAQFTHDHAGVGYFSTGDPHFAGEASTETERTDRRSSASKKDSSRYW
jgi:hypothetical protein